jgi:hypothetical protein
MVGVCLERPIHQNKDWLYDQYWNKKKSAFEIGNICNRHEDTIRYWMRKHHIPRRNSREYTFVDKLYTNKDWLYHHYVELEMSGFDIADICGVCFQTIYAWLMRHGIKCRIPTNDQLYKDKDFLYEHYVVKEMSVPDIGKKVGVTGRSILNWLIKHNIPIERRCTEGTRRKISKSKMGEKNPSWKGGPEERICRTCGKTFFAPKCRTQRFCSLSCIDRKGSNNSRWNGGSSFEPYPIIFNHELREWIRNRDNRVCQLCGKSEIENRRRLTVHHIDGNKANCDANNLIAVCLSCNSTTDTAIKEFLCRVIVSNR